MTRSDSSTYLPRPQTGHTLCVQWRCIAGKKEDGKGREKQKHPLSNSISISPSRSSYPLGHGAEPHSHSSLWQLGPDIYFSVLLAKNYKFTKTSYGLPFQQDFPVWCLMYPVTQSLKGYSPRGTVRVMRQCIVAPSRRKIPCIISPWISMGRTSLPFICPT